MPDLKRIIWEVINKLAVFFRISFWFYVVVWIKLSKPNENKLKSELLGGWKNCCQNLTGLIVILLSFITFWVKTLEQLWMLVYNKKRADELYAKAYSWISLTVSTISNKMSIHQSLVWLAKNRFFSYFGLINRDFLSKFSCFEKRKLIWTAVISVPRQCFNWLSCSKAAFAEGAL